MQNKNIFTFSKILVEQSTQLGKLTEHNFVEIKKHLVNDRL